MYNYDNLSKYKVFLCVAECGSISQSAEQLYISQPAVSMTIKKLEESLGTTLFLRKPRGVVLTKIDVALMAKPDNISGLEYYPLGAIQDTFVCTPSYLKRLNCNGFEIFERGNIMLLNKDNVSRMHINNYYAENNINPTHILEVNDMDMLIEFAKIGIGVSCVVKQFVKNELSNGSLIEINLPNAIPPRETGFLYNQNIQPFNDNILRLININ